MRTLVIALLLGALPLTAAAQGVYKYTDKKGRVIYTDDPKAGGGRARPVEDATTIIASPPSTGDTANMLEQAEKRDAALDRAVSDISTAYGALRSAEVRKEAGVEPIEGERQGRRFRPEYWQRQQALQYDVDVARARLSDALERRNALK